MNSSGGRFGFSGCAVVIALLLVARCSVVYAASRLDFSPIYSSATLPTNDVRKLYQDHNGYLWIATLGGLIRYDGNDYRLYKTDPVSGRQILNSYVNMCVEDDYDHLWIGTSNGVYILDFRTDSVHKVACDKLENSRIEGILPSRDRQLVWIATNCGLFVYKYIDGTIEACTMETFGIPATDMKSIVEDKDGDLWIGTWNNGLFRYDVAHRKSYHFLQPELYSSHTLFIDNSNQIWVGTWGHGLIKLVNPYDNNPLQLIAYAHDEHQKKSLLDNIVYTVSQEPSSGAIWVGTRSGLSILQDINNPCSFDNYSPIDRSLPYNEINSIIPSSDNLMWVGSLGGGVFYADLQRVKLETDPLSAILSTCGTSNVRVMRQNHNDGSYWMSVGGFGLFIYYPDEGRSVYYRNHPYLQNIGMLSSVNDIAMFQQYVLLGTEQGLVIYDTDAKQITVPDAVHRLLGDAYIADLMITSDSALWLATRTSVAKLGQKRDIVPFNSLVAPLQPALPPCHVVDMASNSAGDLWFATTSCGIVFAHPTDSGYVTRTFSVNNDKLLTEGCNCIYVDSDDRVWAGLDLGLYLYDDEADCFMAFPQDALQGFLGRTVNNVWEDADGNIWITSSRGALNMHVSWDKQLDYMQSYSAQDGLLDTYFHRNAVCALQNRSYAIVGAHGINYLPNKRAQGKSTPAKVVLTDFKLSGQSVFTLPPSEYGQLTDQSLYSMTHIRIPHQYSDFSITFALLSYRNSNQNSYRYQLVGFDKNPHIADANHRLAYYNNLPQGDYTFVVQATDANGVDAVNELCLQITILPPWWKTVWAYIIYLLVFLALLWLIVWYFHSREVLQRNIALVNMQKTQAEELSHSKLQFFTNISHELLTPLSVIMASIDNLRAEHPREDYDVISENAMRLVRLIQQILEFRKAETNNLKLRVSQGNLTQLVENSIKAFLPLAHKKNINFLFDTNGQAEVIGYFDSDKLDKILYNLFSNATKYNYENGQVFVSLNLVQDTKMAVLQVTDTGVGMSSGELKHIFQRFYDGSYRKLHTSGTGIGLSLVKDLVTLHHGIIRVKSEQGEGTTFTVELPLAPELYSTEEIDTEVCSQELATTISQLEQSDKPHQEEQTEKTTVMVVEDNADLLSVITHYLSAHYATVLSALSADEALRMLRDGHIPDIVVSDIMMPGTNGYDFCAIVKQEFLVHRIPVILITAKQSPMDQIMAYEVGADGYIAKPLVLSVLEAKIHRLLTHYAQIKTETCNRMVYSVQNYDITTEDEKFVQEAVEYVNRHISDSNYGLIAFAEDLHVSRSTLNDRLKQLTGLSPIAFINDIRMHVAYQLLNEHSHIRISELAYSVGFNDAKYFSTLFKKTFGTSPRDLVKTS